MKIFVHKYFPVILTSMVLLFSCSNPQAVILNNSDSSTLRSDIKNVEESTNWTKAIEEDILTKNVSKFDDINNSVSLTPELFKAITNKNAPIYPSLEGFGSLDISSAVMETGLKQAAVSFCEAVNKNIYKDTDTLFNPNYFFNYIFFRYDFIDGWKENFEEEFPQKTELKAEEEQIKLGFSYILGQPFNGEEVYQIPVRLFCKKGNVDLCIYFTKNADYEFKINEIEIIRWVGKNGQEGE